MSRRVAAAVCVMCALVGVGCTGSEPEVQVSSATTCDELKQAAVPVMTEMIETILGEVVGMEFEDLAQMSDDEVPGFTPYEEAGRQIELKGTELGCDPNQGEEVTCSALDQAEARDEAVSMAILDGLRRDCALIEMATTEPATAESSTEGSATSAGDAPPTSTP